MLVAGVVPHRAGPALGAYRTAESLPAQKRVKKRKGPDGTSLDRVSKILLQSQHDIPQICLITHFIHFVVQTCHVPYVSRSASSTKHSAMLGCFQQAGLELPESALYTKVLDIDRQLDSKLAQQRAHVAVMVGSSKKMLKTLRVFLQSRRHNTVPSQSGQASGQSDFCPTGLQTVTHLCRVSCPVYVHFVVLGGGSTTPE